MSVTLPPSHFDHLLKGVIEAPDDDRFRLLYARDLERAGADERATFIRIQIHLARLPQGTDHPEWFRLASNAQTLQLNGGVAWIPSWYSQAGVRDAQFHRGFIECVTVPAEILMEPRGRERLFNTSPIRHLNIVGLDGDNDLKLILERFQSARLSPRIVSLRLDGQHLGDEIVKNLGEYSFRNLRWLSLAHNSIGEMGVKGLADDSIWGPLKNLEYVNLEGNPADPKERICEDQGVAIDKYRSRSHLDLPARWLQQTIIAGRLVPPDRFALAAGGNSDAASAAVSA